ncbi:hypothetical protein H6P81_017038 [Aristolochia fimbriata]|uniref:Cation/H+ exchanger domain-containing protein n=1 Tax=Aristolochia fimbriata TaxID=158543 RepID=A0AAV7DXE7_ARIFI|nr:hypothetical protein H6P81_017038 [Aristolochia fimbriata]
MALNTSMIHFFNDTGGFSQTTCLVPQKIWYYGSQRRNRSLYYFDLPLLLLQIITFICITCFLRFIFKPFKQPMIVSEIIAGIIMGPTLLGSYEEFHTLIFPTQGQILSDTLAWIGIIYYLYVEGLKQDIRSVTQATKKELVICFIGMLSSFSLTTLIVITTKPFQPDHIKALGLLKFIPGAMAITNFAVVQPIVAELGLSNYELGRLSMSLSVLNNAMGLLIGLVNQTIRWSRRGKMYGVYTLSSNCAMYVFMLAVARPATKRVVRWVPVGTRPNPTLVFAFLLLPLVVGAISDMIGSTLFQATLLLGTLIPPGPPLGSVLVEKIEAVVRFFLLPLFFIVNGRKISLFEIPGWSNLGFMLLVSFSSCLGKFLGTMFTALYYHTPYQESVTLGLIMCFKGIVELLVFSGWMHFQVIDTPTLASLELASIAMTAITTPLVRHLVRRSTRMLFTCNGRSIEQSRPNTEFRLIMCVYNEDNVPTLLNLLNASSNSTKMNCPIYLCVLHLVELIGRGAPILTAHKKHHRDGSSRDTTGLEYPIFRAFENLAKGSGGFLLLNLFTSISPHKTMHQDVCTLATDKNACLVIVPLYKQASYGEASVKYRASRLIARNILYEAPCSVGVLFDRSNMGRHVPKWTTTGEFTFRVGIVFLGGADDREALCYASRMVDNPGVSLMVLHCLAPYSGLDHQKERLLDEELMGEFKLKAMQQDNVVYREETVVNGEEMVSSIHSMGSDFDLMVVGRRHPVHFLIMDALTDWSECVELGVIGDFFASPDFANLGGASVLSIQQKIMIL